MKVYDGGLGRFHDEGSIVNGGSQGDPGQIWNIVSSLSIIPQTHQHYGVLLRRIYPMMDRKSRAWLMLLIVGKACKCAWNLGIWDTFPRTPNQRLPNDLYSLSPVPRLTKAMCLGERGVPA